MLLILFILLAFGILSLVAGSRRQGVSLLCWAGLIILGGGTFLGTFAALLAISVLVLPVAFFLGK